jgi:cellulose synthase/poly-beta-1,6-N-acetylglucosamine synthase-like glycosyltransferase/spore germination protein YaaH/peptidoglycan/xylan/chitin deacetylase (PgdA/CDA1 family)
MASKPVFYDPQRKRWRRLRHVFDAMAVGLTLLLIFFVYSVLKGASLPNLLLPEQKKSYHALKEKELHHTRIPRSVGRRKSKKPASQVVLNSGEGIRAAYYVTWDAGSYASLREYLPQIDLLYPEWLHVVAQDGRLQSVTQLNKLFDVLQNGKAQPVDDKVMQLMRFEKADTEVLPLVNNFDPTTDQWVDISTLLATDSARANARQQLMTFLASDNYKGLNLDFENIDPKAQAGYKQFVSDLYDDLHTHGLKLHISVPVADKDFDYGFLSAHSDGLVLMNYDEHYGGGDPGPIASQEWFTKNLVNVLKIVPREKVICAVGSYGYDWQIGAKSTGKPPERSVQEAWLDAHDSESEIVFDPDSLNPHFGYLDDDNHKHEVWFLDGVTVLNEMRAARALGIQTFALWRLGSEDRSMWSIWDQPGDEQAPNKLRQLLPGQDVDMEGRGEILHIASRPQSGERSVAVDASTGLVTGQKVVEFPTPYVIDEYGARDPKKIAITFDDGPDPQWTPKMLDVLKQKNAKATFFVIGVEGDKYASLLKRMYNEGNEIGNHTFTHPDISNVSKKYLDVELNLTEMLFASRLGAKTLLFRPPYSIDQEPDTADQVRPLETTQNLGYVTIGDKLDPNDWRDNPRRSAQEIVDDVMSHLPPCKENDQRCGNILLLHDGGGDRSETVKALGPIIDGLRERGFEVVPVSELIGKTRAEVMPPLSSSERWSARIDRLAFDFFGIIMAGIVLVFYIGDILMSARLLMVGTLAIFDRWRGSVRDKQPKPEFTPAVAILIPAYNEEKVIERTVRAALMSHYPNFRVIVIDDGSTDKTYEVAKDSFADEIAAGKVVVLTKTNSGKAEALNYGLEFVTEEIFVGIDADTVIARDAVARLVPHFLDARIGAVAGNAKVGNRVNLWTRWQALEYITSQNFERRALNALGAVSVVPGAIGAWKTSAVREAGQYHVDTVAEDGDLTMALLENGYRVVYEDRALAWTEAPMNARGLMRQRFRWSFGILQAVFKHRGAFARKGALGWVALPNIVIFQILLPLVSPFIDLMFVIGLISYGLNKHFHPETANSASLQKLVVFFVTFMVIDFIASTIAFLLERREANAKEDGWLLAHVWLQRFAYRQLFSVVLVKTLKRAMEGRAFNWDKLERTATLSHAKVGS